MENLFGTFLLLLSAIVGILTYLVIPYIPVVVLAAGAAAALAVGVWWHWTQFSTDYRTSTWQEQLRSYASYVIVLVVILLSYGFYSLTQSPGGVNAVVASARNTGRRATSQIMDMGSRASTATMNFFAEPSPSPAATSPFEAEKTPSPGGFNFLA